jgi:hypothetical protein
MAVPGQVHSMRRESWKQCQKWKSPCPLDARSTGGGGSLRWSLTLAGAAAAAAAAAADSDSACCCFCSSATDSTAWLFHAELPSSFFALGKSAYRSIPPPPLPRHRHPVPSTSGLTEVRGHKRELCFRARSAKKISRTSEKNLTNIGTSPNHPLVRISPTDDRSVPRSVDSRSIFATPTTGRSSLKRRRRTRIGFFGPKVDLTRVDRGWKAGTRGLGDSFPRRKQVACAVCSVLANGLKCLAAFSCPAPLTFAS